MRSTRHPGYDVQHVSGHYGRVSVAVMAHPSRESFVSELVEALDRDATVVWDEKSDRWDTGRRSMLAYDPDATHHLVIQDDSLPAPDLVAGIERVLPWIPPLAPMVLYIGRVRPYAGLVTRLVDEAEEEPTSWIVMDQINWGPGIVVPTATLPDMIEHCDKWRRDQNYDRRISRWFEYNRIEAFYPYPSLVEHRDSPSLIPARGGRRHAHRFIEGSALEFDPTGRRGRVSGKKEAPGQRQTRRKQQLVRARIREQQRAEAEGEGV